MLVLDLVGKCLFGWGTNWKTNMNMGIMRQDDDEDEGERNETQRRKKTAKQVAAAFLFISCNALSGVQSVESREQAHRRAKKRLITGLPVRIIG